MSREAEIQRACLDWLRAHHIPAWRQNSRVFMVPGRGGRMRPLRAGVKGCADILGLLPPLGRLLAIEVKSPTGRVTPEQAEFLRVIAAAGGCALVVRSLEDLVAGVRPTGQGQMTQTKTADWVSLHVYGGGGGGGSFVPRETLDAARAVVV